MYLCLALVIAVGLFIATLFTVFYHRVIYLKRLRPSYDHSYKPRCSIILPCKGIPQNFEQNIRSFFTLDYPSYEVIFAVERKDDPCVPIINKVIQDNPGASLAVAGITTSCSQKNFNMIAALDIAHDPEVYVFADSDIQLTKQWLTELVMPLSNHQITVASGFRWLYSSSGNLPEIMNAFHNTLLFVLFSVASFIQNVGLWGGSMAIRKKDFEDMGVREFWAQTVVDDMSLSNLVIKYAKKSVMVSSCLIPTDDALQTKRQGIRWFKRQVMFLKAYQTKTWVLGILLVLSCLFLEALLPVALIGSLATARSFAELGGYASLVFIFGTMASAMLYPLLGKHPNLFMFFLYQPFSLLTLLYATFSTLFTNTVKWSGFWYKLNFSGKVISVEQHK